MSQNKAEGKSKSLKDCVRHFTPAWFAVIMGTGAISVLFHNFPYAPDSVPMKVFTAIFFFLNLFLFILFNVLTISRYIFFPDIWPIMIRHPVQSLYVGCYPMGAATLINIGVGLIYDEFGFGGKAFVYVLWGFWWLDVVISFLCAFVMIHVMKTRQDHALNRMTAIWILPVVTLIVASSSGGVLAPALKEFSVNHALVTLALSAVMVAIGEALALMILTMYFFRLIVNGIPQGASVVSVFIPLGPMSQGGYGILLLGSGFRSILPLAYGDSEFLRTSTTGEIINVVCVCTSLVLWSLASMWLLYGILSVWEVLSKERFPFKLPLWGLIFPNGVYANLTIELYSTLDSPFFRIWGCIYACITIALWTAMFLRTLMFVRNGAIFEAPCLEEIDMAKSGIEKRQEEGPSNGHAPSVVALNGDGKVSR